MKAKTRQIDGEFWFTARYAAELLGTTRKVIETMAVRELVRALPEGLSFLIAESDVTRLRRDPEALREAKSAAKLPSVPTKSDPMPSGTIYKGDPPKRATKTYSRVGNPLADEGRR